MIFNKNNFYKTFHHIKNGNFGFITTKIKQKIKDNLPIKINMAHHKSDKNCFDFMFKQNNHKDIEYKKLILHESLHEKIKTVAFYLPQFHPIKENDENWGKGFTEWTNVSKAIPQFQGHYQPRLPGELGFYDLRLPEIRHQQISLAKNYGIDAFCFHFYWFNGKRVLEKPLEDFVSDKSHNFSFCVNWANENWTRRWDGLDSDILLEQKYSEDDDIAFIKEVSKLFNDSRYMRIDDKPLLMIYRVSLFPNIKETAKRWRKYCKENGIGEIYLLLTHSFEHTNPEEIDFDAAVEFSPNTFSIKVQNSNQKFYNSNYNGMVLNYDDAITYSLKMKIPQYKKFKTVFPSWDNEARKPGKGTSFINSTPQKFQKWLEKIYLYTQNNFSENEQLVFINAWNEWAEGAYLEPDKKYGYAYLEALYNAKAFFRNKQQKIIVITHDAYLHGAQYLSLHIALMLRDTYKYNVTILANGDGPLLEKFDEIGTLYKLFEMRKEEKSILYKKLYNEGIRYAIANTSTIGTIVRDLKKVNILSLSLIHEMENVILQYNLKNSLNLISENADKIIFPSQIVKSDFEKFTHVSQKKCIIKPQGLYRNNLYKNQKNKARQKLRRELALPENSIIVLNMAYGDKRKGLDLFVKTGIEILEKGSTVHFVWGGLYEETLYQNILKMIHKTPYNSYFHFVGFVDNVDYYYAGSDIFYLTSREDPFPSVVMEAMNVGLPVIGFDKAGGFTKLLKKSQGILIDYLNTHAAADAIIDLIKNKIYYQEISKNAQNIIEKDYNFQQYIGFLVNLTKKNYKKVSVIIPNFNYSKYIKERIESVLIQTYPIYEVIFLDDNSTDDSLEIAEKTLNSSNTSYKIIKNKNNSGSVFKQWAKGLSNTTGDYIWIAEADDLCSPNFLEKVMKGFDNSQVVLSYAQSKMIDKDGNILASDYLKYTNDIDKMKWKQDYIIDGEQELAEAMVVKNTIPNISAVVFKETNINTILNELLTYKVAGDWFFYVWLLKQGKISFISESLNLHRRHDNSVTKSLNQQQHFNEIVRMQNLIIQKVKVNEKNLKKTFKYREYIKKYLNVK